MSVRGLGLVSLLVALVLVGALWSMDARTNGPASAQGQREITQAEENVAGINFSQAAVELESYRAVHGTYVGASVPSTFGARLVRADATSYCLQAGIGQAVQHEDGPNGSPAAGPC